ncbi:MAG TPA: HAD family hydrolase [Fimbriimonadaceae bacterium]|nr:HAD family hydrolase [Fimbriimonadaceae bacterium]
MPDSMDAPPEASRFEKVNFIFFDLDDTLCGYWDACKIGLRKTFALHGPDGVSPEEMVQHWAAAFREFSPTLKKTHWYQGYLLEGEPTRTEQMRLTLKRLGIEDEERAQLLSQTYARERDDHLELFEEAKEVLDTLKPRYPMGLITNGPADIQRQEIATLGIESYFSHIFIEGEMGRGKPLPEVFEAIAREIDRKPEQILFVGNSYAHDVKPALLADWRAVWIRRPSDVPPSSASQQAKPEERSEADPVPDAVIGDLRELLPILGP